MASQLWVNGPATLYTNTGSASALEFVGVTEGDVRLDLDVPFEDVHTDFGGSRIPADVMYMGEQAFVSGTLIRWDESVYAKLADRLLKATRGSIDANSIGTLMVKEAATVQLIVDAPYQNKGAFSSMPACYNFSTAFLADTTGLELGTKPKKIRFLFRCITSLGTDGSGTLYTNTRPTLPAIT